MLNQILQYLVIYCLVSDYIFNQSIMVQKIVTILLSLMIFILMAYKVLPKNQEAADLPFEKNLNFTRFMGIWYSVASLPNAIESHCKCPQSLDTLHSQLIIDLSESCIFPLDKNVTSKSKAVATVPGYGNWTNWNGPISAPYYIIEVDKDYQWTLIGQPSRKGFWIMSRKPRMDESLLNTLIKKGTDLGFNMSKLQKADQSCFKQLQI